MAILDEIDKEAEIAFALQILREAYIGFCARFALRSAPGGAYRDARFDPNGLIDLPDLAANLGTDLICLAGFDQGLKGNDLFNSGGTDYIRLIFSVPELNGLPALRFSDTGGRYAGLRTANGISWEAPKSHAIVRASDTTNNNTLWDCGNAQFLVTRDSKLQIYNQRGITYSENLPVGASQVSTYFKAVDYDPEKIYVNANEVLTTGIPESGANGGRADAGIATTSNTQFTLGNRGGIGNICFAGDISAFIAFNDPVVAASNGPDLAGQDNPDHQKIQISLSKFWLERISIPSRTLPDAVNQDTYSAPRFAPTGGTGPYTYTLERGKLPPGLSVTSGKLTGTVDMEPEGYYVAYRNSIGWGYMTTDHRRHSPSSLVGNSLPNSAYIINKSVGGRSMEVMDALYATELHPLTLTDRFKNAGVRMLMLSGSPNGISVTVDPGQEAFHAQSLVNKAKADGWYIQFDTMMPFHESRTQPDIETERQSFNYDLKNTITGIDNIVDWESDARLADCTDTDYFRDEKHLKTEGSQVQAELMLPGVLAAPSTGLGTSPVTYNFTLKVTSADGKWGTQDFTFTVLPEGSEVPLPLVPRSRWTQMGLVPTIGLESWNCLDLATDGSAALDFSGNFRDLTVDSSGPDLQKIQRINKQNALYFDGSNEPLQFEGEFTLKHLFMIVAYEENQFDGISGLLTGISDTDNDILVGNNASDLFHDYGHTGQTYKKNDVPYANNNLKAPMNSGFVIIEFVFPAGIEMDGITIGRQRDVASTEWKGWFVESLAYSRVLNNAERQLIYRYFALKFHLWRQKSDLIDIFPFDFDRATPVAEEFLAEVSEAEGLRGKDKIVRYLDDEPICTYNLQFKTRQQIEFSATRDFLYQHKLHLPFWLIDCEKDDERKVNLTSALSFTGSGFILEDYGFTVRDY